MQLNSLYKPTEYKFAEYFLLNVKPENMTVDVNNGGVATYHGASKSRGRFVLSTGNTNGNSASVDFSSLSFNANDWSEIRLKFIGLKIDAVDNTNITVRVGCRSADSQDRIYFSPKSGESYEYLRMLAVVNGTTERDQTITRPFNYYSDLEIRLFGKEKAFMGCVYNAEIVKRTVSANKTMFPYISITNNGEAFNLSLDGIELTFVE